MTRNQVDSKEGIDHALDVSDLKVYFYTEEGEIRAVDGVSFTMRVGRITALVGESGCGKTTTGRTLLRALEPTAGDAYFGSGGEPINLATLAERELKPLRTRMQMIFQDPFSSLNPRMTVGDIVAEPLVIHGLGSKAERTEKVMAMLTRVGLKAEHRTRYPHAFSGGQRQRIGIARALIMNMELFGEVADPGNLPPGCAFHPRCTVSVDACKGCVPELKAVGDGRTVACLRCGEQDAEVD